MKATTGFLAIGMAMLLGACASTPSAEAPKAAPPAAPTTAAAPVSPAAADSKQTETARLDPNETICRRQATTGSRFATTRCQTRFQWELEQREARKQTEEHQSVVVPPKT